MKIKTMIAKVGTKVKKHSPEILIVSGVVGVVSAAVMACKATRKIDPVIEEHKEARKNLEEGKDVYSDKDIRKATVKLYAHTTFEFVKLYGPSVTLGVLSIGSIFASNDILRKRNASLAAAYAVIDKSFKEYRSRVVEKYGEEADYQFLHGVKTVEVEETVTDAKGKEKTVKKKVEVTDPNGYSGYAKYIIKGVSDYWDDNEDMMRNWLQIQQNYADQRLKTFGKLVLNDVYEDLGFQKTKAGMVVGWVYDLDNPSGDNYVQFDVHKTNVLSDDGVTYVPAYAVDFNVDGNIYDLV